MIRTISASASTGTTPALTDPAGRDVEVPRAWDVLDEALKGYEGIGWYSVVLDGSWARRARSST